MKQPSHRLSFQALAEHLSDVATRLVESPFDADLRCTVMIEVKRSSAADSSLLNQGRDAIIANQYSKVIKNPVIPAPTRSIIIQSAAIPPLPKRPEPAIEIAPDASEGPLKALSRTTPVLHSAQTHVYEDDYLPQSAGDDLDIAQIETDV